MRSPPPAKSLLSVERQLERPRMSCVVAAAVVVVVAVDVDVVAGVGDGCHSGSLELKWQRKCQRVTPHLRLFRDGCSRDGQRQGGCGRAVARVSGAARTRARASTRS